MDQPLAEPEQIEVAVQITREADERAPVIVTVAIVDAIEAGLDGVLDRPGEQHHDGRREERDQRIARVVAAAHRAGDAVEDGVDRDDRRRRRRVHQPALDDHLDVHEAIPDDRGRERQGHEAQQNRRVLESGDRPDAERIRNRVAGSEWGGAEGCAADDPAKLPPRGDRSDAAERADHHGQSEQQTDGEVEHFPAVEERDDAREQPAVFPHAKELRDACAAKQQRRQIDERQQRAPGLGAHPAVRPLGEHQREMEEERRQQQHADDVSPVEDPVERVELAGKRQRHHAEERHRQPEEMQTRLVVRAAKAHAGADQEREDADRREHRVERPRSCREDRDVEVDEGGFTVADDGVAQPRTRIGGVDQCVHLRRRQDLAFIDHDEDVPWLHARARPRRIRRDLLCDDDARRIVRPEHAVFGLGKRPPQVQVRGGEAEQQPDHGDVAKGVVPGAAASVAEAEIS